MTTSKRTVHPLLSALLTTALSVALAACDEDDDPDPKPPVDAGTPSEDTGAGEDLDTGVPANEPAETLACPGVYDQLSEECGACACATDIMLAPACQGPCWDFLACSFVARAGACAESAAGGDATRAAFEACTMDQCGTLLQIPGAMIVSSYRTIIGACAAMGSPPACAGDIARFSAALKK